MSMLDDGPIPAMEGVLSSIIDPDSITGTASHLLARDSFQPDPNRARKAAGHLLGCHRQLHELLSGRSVVGDEQPLVGNQQRRRELAAQTWGAMGRSAVGLDRGGGQVRSPDGRMLFCNGLGRGAASGTQWVLNRARARAPSHLFHTPPSLPSFRAFANISHFSPPFLRHVLVYPCTAACDGKSWSETRDKR
jgi:hypothetical protein